MEKDCIRASALSTVRIEGIIVHENWYVIYSYGGGWTLSPFLYDAIINSRITIGNEQPEISTTYTHEGFSLWKIKALSIIH